MKFTFGIITSDSSSHYLEQVLYSIERENIPEFEVIVIGGNISHQTNIMKVIPFDETQKPSWITRKKNIITETAKYDNIVYMHDYVALSEGWYNGFLNFGEDFKVCMTPIKNMDGSRFRDWTLWPDDLKHILGPWNSKYLLPYGVTDLSKCMYISGAYWIAKKDIMKLYPLDERLSWGESEDVIWSKQIREKHNFSINTHSQVQLLKQKDRVFNEITPDIIETLRRLV